jgi:hypothetical protein
VTGTITQLQRDRGVGTLLAEDRKSYTFRRSDVREVWFHDLTEGATVAFELAKPFGDPEMRNFERTNIVSAGSRRSATASYASGAASDLLRYVFSHTQGQKPTAHPVGGGAPKIVEERPGGSRRDACLPPRLVLCAIWCAPAYLSAWRCS